MLNFYRLSNSSCSTISRLQLLSQAYANLLFNQRFYTACILAAKCDSIHTACHIA